MLVIVNAPWVAGNTETIQNKQLCDESTFEECNKSWTCVGTVSERVDLCDWHFPNQNFPDSHQVLEW